MSEEIVQDETVEEETVEEVEETPEEESEEPAEEVDWEARAKKAEALIVKHKKQPVVEKPTQATPTNVEETVLLAQGMDEELLEQLKKVAHVNGTSLIKAQTDDLFVAVKEKFEKDKKHKSASMPASKGAGTVKQPKSVSSPGLTREEHMALVKKKI
jgi:hypothetical protein